MTTSPFPVLCDRCRAEGLAGEAMFADLADLGDLLEHKEGYATEPLTTSQGFYGEGAAEKRAAIERQCAEDARAQVEWEAKAREEVAAWRARQEAEAGAEFPPEQGDESDRPPG
jgi:hypothetical protein